MVTALRVVIAGAGIAGLEAFLAVKAFAHERVEVAVIAPGSELVIRADAPRSLIGDRPPVRYDLKTIMGVGGGRLVHDRLEAVNAGEHRVRLASGRYLDYDALVLCLGARATAAVPGAITFRDGRDAVRVRGAVEDAVQRRVHALAFAVPAGCAWALPVYELALMTGRRLRDAGVTAALTIATPEQRALEVAGAGAGEAIGELLAERGIRLLLGVRPRAAHRGRLELVGGESVPAGHVIAVPALQGPRVACVPADADGFVRTDADGRVEGLSDVFAAGDMTTYPVKQGGVAAQQAALIARLIVVRAGANPPDPPRERLFRARLAHGEGALFTTAILDPDGRARETGQELSDESPWWPLSKIFAPHLTAHLAAWGRPAAQADSPPVIAAAAPPSSRS